MKCPRCSSTVPATPDPQGFLMCPGCGAKLRNKASATQAPAPAARPAGPSPDVTMPPGTMASVPRPAGTPVPRPASPPAAIAQAAAAGGTSTLSLESLMTELRALRRVQEEILSLLRSEKRGPAPAGELGMSDGIEPRSSPSGTGPVRARRRKSVLLIDDDKQTCEAARAALTQAEVPTRVAQEGNAGLAAIAAEKPDVIAMELELGGAMAGKDVINMIKATMEWVDIPIVLYTRAAVQSQKEARTEHGADEFVIKGPNGPAELVARVIALFRRG